jgi:hypothetical protein
VQVTDLAGCTVRDSFALAYQFQLQAGVTNLQGATCATCADGRVQVEALNGIAAFTFAWADGPTGALRENLAPGSYPVQVTDQQGCTVQLVAEIGIQTQRQSTQTQLADWQLAPNPFTDFIRIYNPFTQPTATVLEVFDLAGRNLVQQAHIALPGWQPIALPDLPTGTYLLSLRTPAGSLLLEQKVQRK